MAKDLQESRVLEDMHISNFYDGADEVANF